MLEDFDNVWIFVSEMEGELGSLEFWVIFKLLIV